MVVGTVLAGACWQNAARYFSLPSWHASQALPDSFWMRGNVRKDLALMAARSAKPTKFLSRVPGVYPYSVVPGGVKDPDDLRYAALRDYVVRRHYAHFDYSHAHLVRASEAREVYLSYRVRDAVFWTRRKIRLHRGELLLTDGKITARARCGNQISDTAKPEVSNEEPDEDVLDQPVVAVDQHRLPVRPVFAPPDLPGGGPSSPQLFAHGFFFPYVPASVPLPSGVCRSETESLLGTAVPSGTNTQWFPSLDHGAGRFRSGVNPVALSKSPPHRAIAMPFLQGRPLSAVPAEPGKHTKPCAYLPARKQGTDDALQRSARWTTTLSGWWR